MRRWLRWLFAVEIGLVACAPEPPVVVDTSVPICEAACARRIALGCIEPRFVGSCVTTCNRTSAAGLYDPTCVAHATRSGLEECGVRCDAN